jgi:hypothetical protein
VSLVFDFSDVLRVTQAPASLSFPPKGLRQARWAATAFD